MARALHADEAIDNNVDPQVFKLQRGFKWIGPFFASLIPLVVWAFFIDRSEPPNPQGGILAIGVLTSVAVFCHLTAQRTFVRVTDSAVEVGGIRGVRTVLWSDVRYALTDRGDLLLHVTTGKPLKISGYLERIDRLMSFVEARHLFRDAA